MEPQQVSLFAAYFVVGTLGLAGVLDVYLAGKFGRDATISAQVQIWCARWPILYIALAWLLFHVTDLPSQRTP